MKKTLLLFVLLLACGFCYNSLAQVTIPYSNGFENGDPTNFAVANGGVHVQDDAASANTGDCYINLATNYSQVEIQNLPFQAGVTYTISLYIKASVAGAELNFMRDSDFDWPLPSIENLTTDYEKYEVEYSKTTIPDGGAKMTFVIFSYTGPIFIDDINITEKTSTTIPAGVSEIDVNPAALGDLKALVSYNNPSEDVGGQPLATLSGVKVEYTKDYNFLNDVEEYTINYDNITDMIGQPVIDEEVPIIEAGKYYFRFTPFNDDGFSTIVMEVGPSRWIGVDPQVGTPTNLTIQMNSDNTLTLDWDAVTTGNNGGYMDGEISYRINMDNGAGTESFYTGQATYTTDELPFNLYKFEVAAILDGEDDRDSYIKSYTTSISSLEDNMHLVANSELTSRVLDEYPLFLNGYQHSSGISQFIFTPEEVGESYIDKLYFFFEGDIETEVTHRIKIYMGYKDETVFSGYQDWTIPDEEMQLVFNDDITFHPDGRLITLPINGFYYDASRPLLLHITKPRESASSYLIRLFGHLSNDRSLYYNTGSFDYDTGWQTPTSAARVGVLVPAMVTNLYTTVSTISGVVTDRVSGDPVPGAVVTITPKEEGVGMNLNTTVFGSEDGEYSFGYLPENTFNIKVEASGYSEEVKELISNANGIYELDFSLLPDSYSAIQNVMDNSKVIMYPNPSVDGRFNLQLNIDSRMYVFTANGLLISSGNLSAGVNNIDLSRYGRGIYFIRLISATGAKTLKAIVK